MSELIDRSMQQVRHVLVDLRPALLQEMGLAAAIKNELKNISFAHRDLVITFEPADEVLSHRWPEKVEYAVFMIGREAVLNAVQHANAKHIDVQLLHGSPDLQLIVRDDGGGFEFDRRQAKAGHLGLVGMRERAMAIEGHLLMTSTPGKGSTISLDWSSP
jgi:signal transduction histidine kinase